VIDFQPVISLEMSDLHARKASGLRASTLRRRCPSAPLFRVVKEGEIARVGDVRAGGDDSEWATRSPRMKADARQETRDVSL
jgi:hypothetical protein